MQISSKTSQNVAYRVKCWLLQGSITCDRLRNKFWSNCLLLIGRFQLTANKSLGFVSQLRDHSAAQPSVASPCCGMVNMPRWSPILYSSFACQHFTWPSSGMTSTDLHRSTTPLSLLRQEHAHGLMGRFSCLNSIDYIIILCISIIVVRFLW